MHKEKLWWDVAMSIILHGIIWYLKRWYYMISLLRYHIIRCVLRYHNNKIDVQYKSINHLVCSVECASSNTYELLQCTHRHSIIMQCISNEYDTLNLCACNYTSHISRGSTRQAHYTPLLHTHSPPTLHGAPWWLRCKGSCGRRWPWGRAGRGRPGPPWRAPVVICRVVNPLVCCVTCAVSNTYELLQCTHRHTITMQCI